MAGSGGPRGFQAHLPSSWLLLIATFFMLSVRALPRALMDEHCTSSSHSPVPVPDLSVPFPHEDELQQGRILQQIQEQVHLAKASSGGVAAQPSTLWAALSTASAAAVRRNAAEDNSSSPAGIQFAARQQLFDYATKLGLQVLQSKVQQLTIPDVTKAFNLPIVGEFKLDLTGIKVKQFNVSVDGSQLIILDGFFHGSVSKVETEISFRWHWSKLGLEGSGDGGLLLHGGSIDYVFDVLTDAIVERPQLNVVAALSAFESVELKIKSDSADWLYQAVLAVFNEAIRKQVQNGISSVLQQDVPKSLNQVLSTLPTHLQITGLPFDFAFDYSLYTSTYVLVKGYGAIAADRPTASVADQSASTQDEVAGDSDARSVTDSLAARLAASRSGAFTGLSHGGVASDSSTSLLSSAAAAALPLGLHTDMIACPFEVSTPLPVSPDDLAAVPQMASLYLHEASVNCVLWGLARAGQLRYSLKDGSIDKLHLTTDLLAMLIPQLPKQYPRQLLRIDAEATGDPSVSFAASSGVTIKAAYRTAIFVDNATLGTPHIATLAANLTIVGLVEWDTITVTSVDIHHAVESSTMDVPAQQWDLTVGWAIQSYGSLFPLSKLVEMVVKTPVASMVRLVQAKSVTYDGWYALSADAQAHLPSVFATLGAPGSRMESASKPGSSAEELISQAEVHHLSASDLGVHEVTRGASNSDGHVVSVVVDLPRQAEGLRRKSTASRGEEQLAVVGRKGGGGSGHAYWAQ